MNMIAASVDEIMLTGLAAQLVAASVVTWWMKPC
jgi:hypothetical protein